MCSPKGIFKQAPSPEYRLPVVGDQVSVTVAKTGRKGVDGYITKINERANFLSRADGDGRTKVMAANLDRILVVCAVKKPGRRLSPVGSVPFNLPIGRFGMWAPGQ